MIEYGAKGWFEFEGNDLVFFRDYKVRENRKVEKFRINKKDINNTDLMVEIQATNLLSKEEYFDLKKKIYELKQK